MVIHKGITYSVVATETPGVWRWKIRIGEKVLTGRTETRIELMAIRRVKLRIDRELKRLPPRGEGSPHPTRP